MQAGKFTRTTLGHDGERVCTSTHSPRHSSPASGRERAAEHVPQAASTGTNISTVSPIACDQLSNSDHPAAARSPW
jgi:hypothetical protein